LGERGVRACSGSSATATTRAGTFVSMRSRSAPTSKPPDAGPRHERRGSRGVPVPFYLTRIFKQRYGVPPYRYLIGLRIDYASDLLRESSLSVTQVCHRSGFNSLSHFITTFRRHTGMSPSQFRRVVDWERDARRFGQETEPLVERPSRMNF